jgi:Ricin-type beta-trefoil lectin domain
MHTRTTARLAIALTTMLVAAGGGVARAAGQPSAQPRVALATTGWFTLTNLDHGLCLDAKRQYDGRSGDNVQLWRCNGGSNQLWQMWGEVGGEFALRNAAHGLCLDAVRQRDGRDGDNVQLWGCNGGSNQAWSFQPGLDTSGAHLLVNQAHGLYLDAVRWHDRQSGDNVQLWRYNGWRNQWWYQ